VAKVAELRRKLAAAEARFFEAMAELEQQRGNAESPLARASRLQQEAATAREELDRALRSAKRRYAFLVLRLAVYVFLLWLFWRVGWETGHVC
jgi:cation transport ATPase